MLAQILRFNRLATALAESGAENELKEPIADFLDRHRFGPAFRQDYLLPMIGCIWSCPTEQMLRFPVATLIRFCHNHGLLQVADRPQWYTVTGGSRRYVQRLLRSIPDARAGSPVLEVRRVPPGSGAVGVTVASAAGRERFDEVVLACHSDQALALLADADADERSVLGAVRYHANRAVLHTDTALLPRSRRAWAAWNYERAASAGTEQAAVCLHYLINRLQPLPWQQPVVVSLNPARTPDPARVLAEIDYAHPVFDLAAIEAQQRLPQLQGRSHVWFAGAWTRYGFHEDGLRSGLDVVRTMREQWQRTLPAAA
jgi:predicted NAD/FAD-binding protein